MGILVSVIAAFILFCSTSWAATYYVDFTSGNDANNGTSTDTPWKHCPGDTNATGTAGSASLTGGDTVIFKGGVAYIPPTAGITVSSGTSAGSRVIYDGNSAGTWGTGKAQISGNSVASSFGFQSVSKNYWTIQNFDFSHFGDYTDMSAYDCAGSPLPAKTGTGIYVKQSSYGTIQDNDFHEIGIYQNAQPVDGDDDISGWGILVDSGNNLTIQHNDFTKMSYPITLRVYNSSPMNISSVTVHGNTIHNLVRWGITLNVQTNGTLQDIDIDGNTIYDMDDYAGATLCGLGPHVNALMAFIATNGTISGTTLGTSDHPNKIRNNSFYNNKEVAAGSTASTSQVFLSGFGGTLYIFNNTFVNSHPILGGGNAALYIQDGTQETGDNPVVDYHIYNNTFWNHHNMLYIRSMSEGYDIDRAGYDLDIRNNIFYQGHYTGTTYYAVVMHCDNEANNCSAPTTLDYNRYYYATHTSSQNVIVIVYSGSTTYYTLSQAQVLGFEANGAYGDPSFTDISAGLGATSSSNNLTLSSEISGTDLSAYFTTDKVGTTRTGWTIGAYEYNSGSGVITSYRAWTPSGAVCAGCLN